MSVLSLCLNAVIEGMLLTKSDSDKLTYAERNFPALDQSISILRDVFYYYSLLLLLLLLL